MSTAPEGGLLLTQRPADDEADAENGASALPSLDRPDNVSERAQIEWPFQVRPVYVLDLMVDHTYQRPAEERFIATAVSDFIEALVGVVQVSARADGQNAILDGQQRWEMCKRVGKTTMLAAFYTGLSLADEAQIFYRMNRERRAMKGFFGFRARMLGGDEEARAITDTVESVGFQLGPVSDHELTIGAINALERAWRLDSLHRDECLSPSLQTVKVYRGQTKSLHSSMLVGMANFWRAYPDEAVDTGVLNQVLEEVGSPTNLLSLARERIEPRGSLPVSIASVLVERYNNKLRRLMGVTGTAPLWEGRLDPKEIR